RVTVAGVPPVVLFLPTGRGYVLLAAAVAGRGSATATRGGSQRVVVRGQRAQPVLPGRRQHDRGDGGAGPLLADPREQLLKVLRPSDPDEQDVVLVAGHRPAGHDLLDVGEPLGDVVRGGRVEGGDRHQGRHRQPHG